MSKFPSLEKSPNLDQWIEIVSDQQILVHTGKVDIGQRISTALAIIAAEELDVDYDRIQVKRTETGIDPDEGITSGSLSMQNSGEAIRRASATARQFLLKKAATHFDADIADLEIEDGLIQLKDTNRTVSYWDLMEGKPFEIPVDEDVSVKDPENHSQVGQKVTSKGMTEIFSGRYEYLHDMKLPGMLQSAGVAPVHHNVGAPQSLFPRQVRLRRHHDQRRGGDFHQQQCLSQSSDQDQPSRHSLGSDAAAALGLRHPDPCA